MAQPVNVKGRDTTVLPMEAMALSVMQNAMHGDIGAILFIRTMTETRGDSSPEYAEKQKAKMEETKNELQGVLAELGIEPTTDPCIELLARDLMTIRRVADAMMDEGHEDVLIIPQRNGSDKMELSTTNKIVNELCKQWRKDWQEFKAVMLQREMQRKRMKH